MQNARTVLKDMRTLPHRRGAPDPEPFLLRKRGYFRAGSRLGAPPRVAPHEPRSKTVLLEKR
jgi:hypothetical protein